LYADIIKMHHKKYAIKCKSNQPSQTVESSRTMKGQDFLHCKDFLAKRMCMIYVNSIIRVHWSNDIATELNSGGPWLEFRPGHGLS
jgi:hypothetical protein